MARGGDVARAYVQPPLPVGSEKKNACQRQAADEADGARVAACRERSEGCMDHKSPVGANHAHSEQVCGELVSSYHSGPHGRRMQCKQEGAVPQCEQHNPPAEGDGRIGRDERVRGWDRETC